MSTVNSSKIKVYAVSVFTQQGAREVQEDHLIAHRDRGVFAIADGFGGPGAGVDASKLACEEVRNFLIREAGDIEATLPFVLRSYFSLPGNILFNALVHANRQLIKRNKGKSVHEKGGASLLAAYLDGDLLALANVGACDAWLFRDGAGAELVLPKSYARLTDPFDPAPAVPGLMSGFDAAPEEKSVPLMALGIVDDLEPEIAEYRVRPGDWLLLHTDGLPVSVRAGIQALQRSVPDPESASEQALALLNQNQYADNTSALLIIF